MYFFLKQWYEFLGNDVKRDAMMKHFVWVTIFCFTMNSMDISNFVCKRRKFNGIDSLYTKILNG